LSVSCYRVDGPQKEEKEEEKEGIKKKEKKKKKKKNKKKNEKELKEKYWHTLALSNHASPSAEDPLMRVWKTSSGFSPLPRDAEAT
jgi:hypothetical protein